MALVASGLPDAIERSENRQGGQMGGTEKAVNGREGLGFSESKQAGLLPSVGRIVGKFDFNEGTLSTTVAGSEHGAYRRDSVTLIKLPKLPKADIKSPTDKTSRKQK